MTQVWSNKTGNCFCEESAVKFPLLSQSQGAILNSAPESGRQGLMAALVSEISSERLSAAMAAGTNPNSSYLPLLIQRCRIESDFFVRDMLTWALLRHESDVVRQMLAEELKSSLPQARSQALHTLSKIGGVQNWKFITDELLMDVDDEVARAAWRLAVICVPEDLKPILIAKLVSQMGRGDSEVQKSLSRALLTFGEQARPAIQEKLSSEIEEVAGHARMSLALLDNPESEISSNVHWAKRASALNGAPLVNDPASGSSHE